MAISTQIGSAVFAPGFLSAVLADGEQVHFTRAESRALACFSRNPGRVLSRNQLLDAIFGPDSDRGDRNIDFIINRLRKKIGDRAATPEFIGTRYGEGYVWLARPARGRPLAAGAAAVIGPVRGIEALGSLAALATNFTDILFQTYAAGFDRRLRVVLDPDCPPPAAFDGDAPKTGIALTFFADDDALECVIRVSAFRSGHAYFTARKTITGGDGGGAVNLTALARRLVTDIWKSVASAPEQSVPLPFSVLSASETYRQERDEPGQGMPDRFRSWKDGDTRLRRLLAENPRDHAAMIMLAGSIHSKYVLCGVELFTTGADTCGRDEDEIEALVTAALPAVRGQPDLAISAAKLLYFIDRGHRPEAVALARAAHAAGTSVAASLATIGQLRMFLGEIGPGLAALGQAQALSPPGSRFRAAISQMILQALAAAGDRAALEAALAETRYLSPRTRAFSMVCFSDPENPAAEVLAELETIPFALARGLLKYSNYMWVRHFSDPQHRWNVLRPSARLFVGKFGPSVVPDVVLQAVPEAGQA